MTESNVDTNVLYCGDCKHILRKIPDESIDLIYLDPPFFSQMEYENFWIKDEDGLEIQLKTVKEILSEE